jgi:phosphate uptake regulator
MKTTTTTYETTTISMWSIAHHLEVLADHYQEIAVRLVLKEGLPKDDAIVQHWLDQEAKVKKMSAVIASGIHFEAINDYNYFQDHGIFNLEITTKETK